MLEALQLSGQTESSSEAKIVNSIDDAFPDNTIYTTENGIKLKLKKISRLLVVDAAKKVMLPKPPTVFIEDKGRMEENPSDPTYIEELQAAEYQRGMVTIAAYLVLGTSVLEVPAGIDRPEDTEWSDVLNDIQFEVPTKGRARYLAWLKYYALNDTELNALIEAITRLSGLTPEKDVVEVKDSFRST